MKSNDPGATGRALNTGHNRDHPTEDEIRQLATELGIDLAEIFRRARAYPRFGLGHSQVAEKVQVGEIEPPIPLTETGHAVGWTGRQMVIHHWRRLQLAVAKKKQVAA
jgi:signal recognition particle subunit SEC65